MSYSQLTPRMIESVQQNLEYTAYSKAKLLNWFKTMGNVTPIGKGMISHEFTKIEKMEPGEITIDFHTLPDSAAKFTPQTTDICRIGAKLRVPKTHLDAYASNNQINVGLQDLLNVQLGAFTKQIDGFLAYGDAMPSSRTGDVAVGQGKYTGLFNTPTAVSAGDGEDDNMSAAADYISTHNKFAKLLEDADHGAEKYFMISDNQTYRKSAQGNHLLTTHAFNSEQAYMLNHPEIADWIQGPNITNNDGDSRILLTNPVYAKGPTLEQTMFNYRMLESYPVEVLPLYGGYLSGNVAYEFAVIWAGAFEMVNSDSVKVSGATQSSLVFT